MGTARGVVSIRPDLDTDDAYPAIYYQTVAELGIDPVVGPDLVITTPVSNIKTPAQRRRTPAKKATPRAKAGTRA